MKRNMEVIRDILLAVESDNDPNLISGYDADTIKYHQSLIIEADLCKGSFDNTVGNTTNIPSFVHLRNLTWRGHEFIDAVRQKEVWNTIKSDFKDAGLDTIVSVAKELVICLAKKKVTAILRDDTEV